MKVLENISAVTNNPDLRLAALLHDIGKVRTREESEDGSVHFINHELVGSDMVKEIMARLKFPNRAIDNVSFLTRYHMMCKPWEGVKRSRMDRLIRKLQYMCRTEKRFDELMTLIHADNMAHAEGKGLILQRTWDREFLMDVRNHKFEYDEIIARLEQERERMNSLMEQSSIREHIDTEYVNSLMIEIRKQQLRLT